MIGKMDAKQILVLKWFKHIRTHVKLSFDIDFVEFHNDELISQTVFFGDGGQITYSIPYSEAKKAGRELLEIYFYDFAGYARNAAEKRGGLKSIKNAGEDGPGSF